MFVEGTDALKTEDRMGTGTVGIGRARRADSTLLLLHAIAFDATLLHDFWIYLNTFDGFLISNILLL